MPLPPCSPPGSGGLAHLHRPYLRRDGQGERVSTLEVLFGGSITAALSPLAAACLLVFSLLYTPCVAAIASIKRELGTRWAVAVVVWQCALAWVAASIVHLVGLLLGVGL